VTDKIRHQCVENVVVYCDVVHRTIVQKIIDACQERRGRSRLLGMIRGVKFVSIPVADQNRALTFYTEKLGFRIVTDQPFDEKQRWIELRIPGSDTGIVLFQFGDKLKPGGHMNFTFWTDNVVETTQELKKRGVHFTMEPTTFEWGSSAGFEDVDGNTFLLSSK
jgi:catechol 2,3-dioxygenase-like lactoylglutathione lyase family enzyme